MIHEQKQSMWNIDNKNATRILFEILSAQKITIEILEMMGPMIGVFDEFSRFYYEKNISFKPIKTSGVKNFLKRINELYEEYLVGDVLVEIIAALKSKGSKINFFDKVCTICVKVFYH